MIDKKKKYKLVDFNYRLPKKFIAQYPEIRRDFAKLMVVHRDTGKIEHRKFLNITDYMRKNDLLVLNNTKVFPARLFATKDRTAAKVEVFLLRELANDLWEVMVKPARKVRIGNKLVFTPRLMCDVIDNTVSGGRVVHFEYEGDNLHKIINRIGISPLPPYIDRDADAKDKKRYQTVYASERGAVAAPTAGLHFTNSLIKKVQDKGVKIETSHPPYWTWHISSSPGGRPESSSDGFGIFRSVPKNIHGDQSSQKTTPQDHCGGNVHRSRIGNHCHLRVPGNAKTRLDR